MFSRRLKVLRNSRAQKSTSKARGLRKLILASGVQDLATFKKTVVGLATGKQTARYLGLVLGRLPRSHFQPVQHKSKTIKHHIAMPCSALLNCSHFHFLPPRAVRTRHSPAPAARAGSRASPSGRQRRARGPSPSCRRWRERPLKVPTQGSTLGGRCGVRCVVRGCRCRCCCEVQVGRATNPKSGS